MSVRGHLIRLVLAVTLPLALLSGAFVWQLIVNEREAVQESMKDLARLLSLGVDTEIRRTITSLELLALSAQLTTDDIRDFREKAFEARKVHGGWSNVVLARPDGTRVFNLNAPSGAPPVIRPVPAAVMESARTLQPAISDAATSPTSGKTIVLVAVPVVRHAEARYVLIATIEYDVWTEWLRAQIPAGWIAAIDDRQGRIFARSERPDAFVGKAASESLQALYRSADESVSRHRNLEGATMYTAYHRSKLTGWHTLLVVPARIVDAPVNRRIVTLSAGMGVALLLAVAFAFVAARPAVTGIGRLRGAIGALVTGEAAPAIEPTRIDEIDEAADYARKAGALLQARAESVAALQRQLGERAEAAEHASRAKDQFLGMLGHELRNPLAAIGNATAVLMMQAQGASREMLEIVRRQTRQLTALVDDLLDVSRAASGKLQLRKQATDLGEVVARVKASLDAAGALDLHDVRVDLARAPIQGDAERLAQVARNLIENAAKYTPPGGVIDVRVQAEDAHAVLRVRDNGAGIDAELLPRIFEPFVQAPQSIERGAGGLGLGLAIASQVVALHDGTIEARSDGPGRGAEFVVRIPLLVGTLPAGERGAPPERASGALRVALIEDHDDSRISLAALLRGEGHRVQEAADGVLGLVLLQRDRFDVAFVDIGLPGLDGYEVVRRARASGTSCRLVALTGYGQAADRERAMEAGFDDFLVKPATAESVHAALAGVTSVASSD